MERIFHVFRPRKPKITGILEQAEEVLDAYAGRRSGYGRTRKAAKRDGLSGSVFGALILLIGAGVLFFVCRLLFG